MIRKHSTLKELPTETRTGQGNTRYENIFKIDATYYKKGVVNRRCRLGTVSGTSTSTKE